MPGDRIEVIWNLTDELTITTTQVYYPGVVVFDRFENNLIIIYDDETDNNINYKIKFIDEDSLLNINENCEMTWRFEDNYNNNNNNNDGNNNIEENNCSNN